MSNLSSELGNNIKLWMQYENNIKLINSKLKEVKDSKNNVENNILRILSSNNLTNKKIKVNNSYITCQYNYQNPGLSYKFIESALTEYLNNEEESKKICEFIKSKRETNKKKKVGLKQIKI